MDARDYLEILGALESLPFPMGKKLLIDYLVGAKNEATQRLRLDKEKTYGVLSGYSTEEIDQLLTTLLVNGLVEKRGLKGKEFVKVLGITEKGKRELKTPTLQHRKFSATFESQPITDADRTLFSAFDFFLKHYNDEQKQAITSRSKHILCVAGAGSGKTTVLTKRIEYLVRFCGVPKERILAITFTRKARQEMEHRLQGLVQVETFNSFCEKTLTRHGAQYYGKSVRVLDYRDRMRLLYHALRALNLELPAVINTYFTERAQHEKGKEQLSRELLHDCFTILDYYANSGGELLDFSNGEPKARMIYEICKHMRDEMKEQGLRDYGDQIRDTLDLFKKHPTLIPHYTHILVDEYQDVNTVQQELLRVLDPSNLFVVGDPRQSIFGWRGSRLRFILSFGDEHEDCTTIVLKQNYRSSPKIVRFMNNTIKKLNLPDLEASASAEGRITIQKLRNEDEERDYIAEQILKSTIPREEIFVLTRTNRELRELSQTFTARGIIHVLRSDDQARPAEAKQGEVTLSTVHAIKGLEAEMVFVAGATAQHFPCIVSDHPVLDLVKREEHDREEEELRLFYVAMSRAKRELTLTYTGTPTKFLTAELQHLLASERTTATITAPYKMQGQQGALFTRLKEWRTALSRKAGVPPYMILSDRSLLELSERKPDGMIELQGIYGIGPSKAQKYGEELLDLVRHH